MGLNFIHSFLSHDVKKFNQELKSGPVLGNCLEIVQVQLDHRGNERLLYCADGHHPRPELDKPASGETFDFATTSFTLQQEVSLLALCPLHPP